MKCVNEFLKMPTSLPIYSLISLPTKLTAYVYGEGNGVSLKKRSARRDTMLGGYVI